MLLTIVKGDRALVWRAFGLCVAAVHRHRGGLVLAGAAAAAFLLLVGVILPAWMERPYFSHFTRWGNLGSTPGELLLSPFLRPAQFFGTLVQPERLGYLVLLIAPLAGLPLLAPEILAVGLPPLASNLLSTVESQYTIRGHYTATLTPILIAAAVVGGRRLAGWWKSAERPERGVLAALMAATLASSVAFSPLPWSQDPSVRKYYAEAVPRPGLPAILDRIGPEASVSASNNLGAHVASRRTLKMFPDGLDASDFVLLDVSGFDYIGPALDPPAFRRFLLRAVETRHLVAAADGLALFDRGKPSPETVAKLVNLRDGTALRGARAGILSLAAAQIAPARLAPRSFLRAHYTWVAETPFEGIPCIAEAFVSSDDRPVLERRRPLFHGLLSGGAWPPGFTADDDAMLVVPETLPAGSYKWVVVTWSGGDPDSCREKPAGAAGLAVTSLRIDPW